MSWTAPVVAPHRVVALYGDPAAGFLAPGGGINVFIWGLVTALRRRGEAVEIITARYPGQQSDGAVPGRLSTSFGGGPLALGVAAMSKRWLADHLESVVAKAAASVPELERSRSVYTHYWLSGAFWSLMRARHPGLRSVRWAHSSHSLGALRSQFVDEAGIGARIEWEERILGEADAIFVSSEAERRVVEALYAASPRRLDVVPGGCDVERFTPGDSRYLRNLCDVPTSRSIVLYLGRLEERKGYRTFLEIARELRDDPRFSFVVVGGRQGMDYEDAGRAAVLAWLEDEGLDNLSILPAVPHEDVPEVLRSAMCIVLPSTYEPFGLTALEAQACGCVPIAAHTGGLTATIDDGRTGFLLPADAKEMALAVTHLADDGAAREEVRSHAVAWVRERFSWDALAPRYAEVLEAC